MRIRRVLPGGIAVAVLLSTLYALQLPFREFPGVEYRLGDIPLPPDFQEKTEWAFARLMYPPAPGGRFGRGYGFRGGGLWNQGNTIWTQDYPRADRHFVQALRRLTRIQVRSVEQPVNLDEGGQFDWPWMYAVEVGHWGLTDDQVLALREYFQRGGFLMVDDFHGTDEWENFAEGLRRVFPGRPIVDIENPDPIFHIVYDLDQRYQVPGAQYLRSGRLYESDGVVPRWRGVYDDKGRLMAAICHNMDLGDSWEHADNPEYDQKFSALGIRIGVNYVLYAMTH